MSSLQIHKAYPSTLVIPIFPVKLGGGVGGVIRIDLIPKKKSKKGSSYNLGLLTDQPLLGVAC